MLPRMIGACPARRRGNVTISLAAATLLALSAGGCATHRPRTIATEVPSTSTRAGARERVPPREPAIELPVRPNGVEVSFAWPVAGGRLLSGFGVPRASRTHAGIDIGAPAGHAVTAAREGRVVHASASLRGYGKTVILEHDQGFHSLYAHNSQLLVSDGEWVERGQPIARVGRTGNATTEHCHFEIRLGEVPVDPLRYLEQTQGRR